MKITAAIAREPSVDLSIETVELNSEELGPEQILVKVMASGICHTDITARDIPPEMELPFPFMPKPIILGHEGAGIVEKVGSDVTHVEAGDRVLMSYHHDKDCPSPYCENYVPFNLFGTAPDGGYVHHDEEGNPLSMMHHQSSLATYSVSTVQNTHKLPDDIPFEHGAPIGCGIMTGAGGVRYLLDVQSGSVIVVFGCGAVGMAAIAAASDLGCAEVIAVDLSSERLEVAKLAGATRVINASEENAADVIMADYPFGVNYTLEATGVKAVIETAIAILAPQGKCALFGATSNPLEESSFQSNLLLFGKQILGGLMGHGNPVAIIDYVFELIRAGKLPMDRIIETYPFEEVNKAISGGVHAAIKPVVVME